MSTDQIADMFTRIRNAIKARKKTVTVPGSNVKKEIVKILHDNHFISKYAYVDDGLQGVIKILLKYNDELKNAIQGIQRISSPGCRVYKTQEKLPKVLNGMGLCIVSTSKGILSDKDCRKMNIGGELIGKIW